MTTISDLPRDMVEEIVSRIPLKLMREVRLTCREWNSLLKSESLTKMRIGKEETMEKQGESRMVVLTNDNLYLMSIVVDEKKPCTEVKGKLSRVKIYLVFHCEGLLLCILKDDKTRLVVWNPYSGQTRSIQLIYRYTKHIFQNKDRYGYALGYKKNKKKKKKKSHKILRFVDTEHCFTCYEIYDFESGLWTTLEVTPHWRIHGVEHGVSLKGNSYWCASERNSPIGSRSIDRIICFDFTRERFGPLLRLPFSSWDGTVNLSCVREEKLAALYHQAHCMEIWITTKIEPKKMSWNKFLTLELGPEGPIDVQNFSFFIDEVKKVAMLFERIFVCGEYEFLERNNFVNIIGVAGDVRQVELGEIAVRAYKLNVCPLVPSFVQIKQPARGKKRKQSILENCRFDQKLLIMKKKPAKGES
ncbi:unnamed protein product [Microthlaspi erraticum]|uniref:F-box domain-containing protein n=1 Tax=Microthlaspi erraticum TaxID=1685480 RepID=A0A6D2HZA3_9BRAS|nr:unnamed protein product [Microthlaspi erraticum]